MTETATKIVDAIVADLENDQIQTDLRLVLDEMTPAKQRRILDSWTEAVQDVLDENLSPGESEVGGPSRTIAIEVRGGVVQDVENLPPGWGYEVIDHDVERGE
jgi:hypothetical protein